MPDFPPRTDTDPSTDPSTDPNELPADLAAQIMTLVHEQLRQADAAELAYFATDDLAMFCALALARVRKGALVVPPPIRAALERGMGG